MAILSINSTKHVHFCCLLFVIDAIDVAGSDKLDVAGDEVSTVECGVEDVG